MTIIKNVRLIEGGRINDVAVDVHIKNGLIADISRSDGDSLTERFLAPCYVDIHTHGAAGHDVSEATPEAMEAVGNYLLSKGVAAYLPTFVATPLHQLDAAFRYNEKNRAGGATSLARTSKAPTISPLKRERKPLKTSKTSMKKKTPAFFRKKQRFSEKIVTLCPATVNAEKLVRLCTKLGVKTEAGHEDSLDFQIEKCMENGLDGATHIYCASSGFRRVKGDITKYLGLNETALYYDGIFNEVMADDVHIFTSAFRFYL